MFDIFELAKLVGVSDHLQLSQLYLDSGVGCVDEVAAEVFPTPLQFHKLRVSEIQRNVEDAGSVLVA